MKCGVTNLLGEATCDRPSCRPPDYAPLCSRHYLQSVDQAQKNAAARFQAHLASLEPNESTLVVSRLLTDYGRARHTRDRDVLFAYGAELAQIASLILADVAQATTLAQRALST